MSGIKLWSTNANNNTLTPPDGDPEGQAPSTVNNSLRQIRADVRSFYEAADYIDLGFTPTLASATSFRVSGDKTAYFTANRPIKCTDASVLPGYIQSSTYSAPNTTVTVSLTSGSLSTSISTVAVSLLDPSNPRAAASIGFLQSGTGAVATDLQTRGRLWKLLTDKGADTTGVTDARTDISNADTDGNFIIPPGTYKVSSNITISNAVQFMDGAKLSIDAAVVVTFSGPITAAPLQIFSGSGTVVISGKQSCVYAEWWGALCNGTNDDGLAVSAAATAMTDGGTIQLLNRGYTFKTAITIATHSITIAGVSAGLAPPDYASGGAHGSRIIGLNGTNCITVNNVGYFKMRDITLYIAAGATSACIGLSLTSAFNAKIDDVRVTNFGTGIKLTSCTDIYINRCYLSSTSATYTTMVGIDIDGTTTQNASVFVSNCIAAHSSFTGSAYGYYLHGNRINDTFFNTCEADFCTYGFYINGTGVNTDYGGDIHLHDCASDSYVTYGFFITSNTVDSAIELTGGWAATTGTGIGVYVATSYNVTVSKMEIYKGANGLYGGASSQGVSFQDNTCLYQTTNGIVIDGSPYSQVIGNRLIQKSAAGITSAIQLLGASDHCAVIGNSAYGFAGGFATGILAAATTTDYSNFIGNIMPSSVCTTPYTENLATNTHSVHSGTTA